MKASDSKRILIADADHETRTMFGVLLAGEGYEISLAVNGREAVALHDRNPHHLIITELGEDGFQVLAQLRLAPSPVKFIATFKKNRLPAKKCRQMCEQLGAYCVLAKPIPPEQLLAAVRSVLD